MKCNTIVRRVLSEFKENELIIVRKLYREELSSQISESTYYKKIKEMCESEELVKLAKGIYYKPKVSKYGTVPPSEKEIIDAFTANETGTVVGYSLYNALNLTTQISKQVVVLSSSLEGRTTIGNIIIYPVSLEFTPKITNMVHGMEVLQNFDTIQDINYSAFLAYMEQLANSFNSNEFEKVISAKVYKKSTISFLREILNYYKTENNLSQHLSSSTYHHPRIKELHKNA